MISSSTASLFSPRQIALRWQTLIEAKFSQVDFVETLAAIHGDFPAHSFWREAGSIMRAEREDLEESRRPSHRGLRPLDLREMTSWPTTTRIDGILPLDIPLASDVAMVIGWLFRDAAVLSYELPEPEIREQVEGDLGLCLLAWLHRRPLKSTYGMLIELNTQCPRSATGAKEELCVRGEMPNGSRATIFYSDLKGRDRLTVPEDSVEYYDALEARRDAEGILRVHGIDLPAELL